MSFGLDPFATAWFPPSSQPTGPDPTYRVLNDSFRYRSSIDSISNLYAGISYNDNRDKKPICVLMHGWNGSAADYYPSKTNEFAEYGFFSIAVGMRGRDGASGLPDANARELYDIIDAVEYVKANYPDEVDPDNIVLAGYSGGGGNSFGLAAKFPDYINVHAAHFGISDAGYDNQESWMVTHPNRVSSLEERVGLSREEGRERYYSRAHQYGIAKNYKNGFIFIYHDRGDSVVKWTQSQMVADEMEKESLSNFSIDITESTDNPRWRHQQPDAGSEVINTRNEWGPLVLNNAIPAWEIADQGSLLIQGYIVTKKFSIWLGNGQEHVADLEYDVSGNSYIVTPLTGEVEVSIVQGNKKIKRIINTKSTLIVV